MGIEGTRRRVLITGAGGRIGRSLSTALAETFDIRRHYRSIPDDVAAEGAVAADITQLNDVIPIMAGIDTVLHLAGEPSVQASWDEVCADNISGTLNMLEAARQSGVRRVVFASTNHVMGMNDERGDWPVYNTQLQRPDSYYGVSKATGEVLGRYYYDRWGVQFIALRIGWFMEHPTMTSDVGRAMWLSPRDCAQIFRLAVESREEFGIFYAISNNPNRRWDLTDAMLRLGYRPEDDWTVANGVGEGLEPTAAPARDWPE